MQKLHRLLLTLAISVTFSATATYGQNSPVPVGLSAMSYAPYAAVGRVALKIGGTKYQGSGTVIRPNGVLTAGHVVFNVDASTGPIGFTQITAFQLAKYEASVASVTVPTQKFVLAGYQKAGRNQGIDSIAAFNHDLGALKFSIAPGGGSYLGWWANPALFNRNDVSKKWSLGYGVKVTATGTVIQDGRRLLVSSATNTYQAVASAFYENSSYLIEGGMSGGPVVTMTVGSGSQWYVIGVNVAGSSFAAGLHALDSVAYNFIQTTLY
jgi:V8-like Glu-specific endopeptidase